MSSSGIISSLWLLRVSLPLCCDPLQLGVCCRKAMPPPPPPALLLLLLLLAGRPWQAAL
jgi:hypothetical protein